MSALSRIASSLFFAALLGPGFSAFAAPASRWSAEQRLTFHPGDAQTTFNFARDVAAGPDGSVHVVWYDDVDGVPQVYTRRSLDRGLTWGPETRLSRLEAPSEHPAVALSGHWVYVVWHDFLHGWPEVVLRRSPDYGATWSEEVRLAEGAHTSVAASGSRVRVVWASGKEGQAEVYTRGSEDAGATWGEESRISETPYESWVPTVELSGERVYVAFVDYGDANEEEYFRRSLDGGVTWEPLVRLTRDAADSWAPSMAVAGDTLHLAWFDRRDAGVSDSQVEAKLDEALRLVGISIPPPPPHVAAVYYLPAFTERLQEKKRTLQAVAPHWVQQGGDPQRLEAMLRDFEKLFETWALSWEIYYKRSLDGGRTWSNDVRLTRAPGPSLRPSIAVSGRDVHIVWCDSRDGVAQVFAKQSTDGGTTWGPDERLTRAPGNPVGDSMHPSLAAAGGGVYVVWTDRRDGNAEIYFKRRLRPRAAGAP